MRTLYQIMTDAVKGKYIQSPEGELLEVIDLNLYEKHAGFSVRNVLTGEEGLVDVLCSKEYKQTDKTHVEIALNERKHALEESEKRL